MTGLSKMKRVKVSDRNERKTSITFTADDLSALVRFVQAGQVMMQTKHPVVSKLKAALTRLGLRTQTLYSTFR